MKWMGSAPPLVHKFFDEDLLPSLADLMLVTKDHSLDLGHGTAVLRSDPGLGQQYMHSNHGYAANAGIDASTALQMRLVCQSC